MKLLHLWLGAALLSESASAFSPSTKPQIKSASPHFVNPFPRKAVTSSTIDQVVSPPAEVSKEETKEEDEFPKDVRPLHQNWWPVSLVSTLKPDRPNSVELFGEKLVLFLDRPADEGNGEWHCLADRCSHRFAPLSEGRLVPVDGEEGSCHNVQCAYHGWEFDTDGTCTKVPQREASSRVMARNVTTYPVRREAGMIFVWGDPETAGLSQLIPLPISDLLKRYHDTYGDDSGYQRDLPYGMEILGENLLDLAHLPFSHHSVGSLDRKLGGPLPSRMLSKTERERHLIGEETKIPMYQVELVDPSEHDPIFLSMKAQRGPEAVSANVTTHIGFFDPCHIRYERMTRMGGLNVELFISPTSAAKARVFLFNVFELTLPPIDEDESKPKMTIKQRLSKLNPINVVKGTMMSVIKARFSPLNARSHMIGHSIFDGDGIFLHKQGDRMNRSNLTYRHYSTPSSADVLLNAFRRYLDSAAEKARQVGAVAAADSVSTPEAYLDNLPRSIMLDRFTSHTASCKICMAALTKSRNQKARWELAHTVLLGGVGASTTALLTILSIMTLGEPTLPTRGILRPIMAAVASTLSGAVLSSRQKSKLDKTIQQFLFEDYVHADKH